MRWSGPFHETRDLIGKAPESGAGASSSEHGHNLIAVTLRAPQVRMANRGTVANLSDEELASVWIRCLTFRMSDEGNGINWIKRSVELEFPQERVFCEQGIVVIEPRGDEADSRIAHGAHSFT